MHNPIAAHVQLVHGDNVLREIIGNGIEDLKFLFYSWRGFNTPPFRALFSGIKPETNTS